MKFKKALLVVDVQQGILADQPWEAERLISAIVRAIEAARVAQLPVIFVRHNEGEGEPLATGSAAWQLDKRIITRPGDLIIDKWFNSAFKKTPLQAHLAALGVEQLMVMGLQTEYCMDATIKSAFDLGYSLVVPLEGHSTLDNGLLDGQTLHALYSTRIWPYSFARVVPLEEALELLTWSE